MLRTKKKGKGKDFDGEFDITPMIDVVLLLLIFFMVSARMAPSANAKLPKAKNGELASAHDAVVLTIKSISTDTAAVMTLTGRKFSTDPDEQSAEITEFIDSALQDATKKYVLIQAEPTVKTRDITRVQQAIVAAFSDDQDPEVSIAVEH